MTQYLNVPATAVNPNNVNVYTMNDTISTYEEVTAPGYLNPQVNLGHSFNENDTFIVKYSGGQSNFKTTIDEDGVITLESLSHPDGPNVLAGENGTAGYFESFSATVDKGSLKLYATANTGNTITSITNAAMGQATVITIPDPGSSTANVILNKHASGQIISSGYLQVSGGSVVAGVSGTSGGFHSYPTTAARGYFSFQGASNDGDTITTLSNTPMGQATTIKISDPGDVLGYLNTSLVDCSNTPVSNIINEYHTIQYSDLSSAGHYIIQLATSGMEFVVNDIRVCKSTGLSGGGGNRLLSITDGVTVWNNAGITAALLGTPVNTMWGGSGNPVPSSGPFSIATQSGASLYAVYSGGTTDYTSGSIILQVSLERIA